MTDEICQYISAELLSGRTAVAPDDPLLTSGVLDSIAIIQLVAFIRDDLGIEVPPQDVTLENFDSAASIAGYLRERQGDGHPAARDPDRER